MPAPNSPAEDEIIAELRILNSEIDTLTNALTTYNDDLVYLIQVIVVAVCFCAAATFVLVIVSSIKQSGKR